MPSSEVLQVADGTQGTSAEEPTVVPAAAEAEKVVTELAAELATELVLDAADEKKSDAKPTGISYTNIIDLISVIENEQRTHHALSWVPSCFDPCTMTAQETANEEIMNDAEGGIKEKAKAKVRDAASLEVKAPEASTDAPKIKQAAPATPKAKESVTIEADVIPTPSEPFPEVTVEAIGSLIQDLFDSDNTKVNAALDAFDANLYEDENKCDKMVTVGGCHALVQLVKNCVAQATEKIPACDQVVGLERPELKTLFKSLAVITNLTYHHSDSQVGITVIGGVESVVNVMKTFPLCRELQRSVCAALCNLTCCPVGKKKALEAGAVLVLIAAVTNHTASDLICQHAFDSLENVIDGNMEHTKDFMNVGGVAALSKVKDAWPENKRIQASVLGLAKLIRKEMKSWMNDDE
jgi:hypothetical protein